MGRKTKQRFASEMVILCGMAIWTGCAVIKPEVWSKQDGAVDIYKGYNGPVLGLSNVAVVVNSDVAFIRSGFTRNKKVAVLPGVRKEFVYYEINKYVHTSKPAEVTFEAKPGHTYRVFCDTHTRGLGFRAFILDSSNDAALEHICVEIDSDDVQEQAAALIQSQENLERLAQTHPISAVRSIVASKLLDPRLLARLIVVDVAFVREAAKGRLAYLASSGDELGREAARTSIGDLTRRGIWE